MQTRYTLHIINSPRGTIYHIRNVDKELIFFGVFEHIAKMVLNEINHPRNKDIDFNKHDLLKMAARFILKEKMK